MIKDRWKLKKDSWHLKLMNFIWGYTQSDFPNMCPYFWLSVLNCLIVILIGIPYLLYKITGYVLGKPCMALIDGICTYTASTKQKVNTYCETKEEDYFKNYIKRLESGDDKAFAQMFKSRVRRKLDEVDYRFMYAIEYGTVGVHLSEKELPVAEKLHNLYLAWEKKQDQIREAKRELEYKKWTLQQQKDEEAKKRRQAIAKMTVKLQFVFKILAFVFGGAAIAGALFLLYNVGLLVASLPWGPIMMWTFVGLIIAFVGLSSYVIIYYVVKGVKWMFCTWGPYCVPCEERRESIGKFFIAPIKGLIWLLKPLGRLFCWMGRGIASFWELLMMIKANNCPPIDWE